MKSFFFVEMRKKSGCRKGNQNIQEVERRKEKPKKFLLEDVEGM